MREILFRGKRSDNKEWVEGYGFCDEGLRGKIVVYYDTFTDEEGEETHYYDFVEVITETVGEYTGRDDKCGKKIFENDIVYAPFWMPNGNGKGVVSFHDSAFRIVWEDASHCDDLLSYTGDIEVIGNVHDNQELLENLQNFS